MNVSELRSVLTGFRGVLREQVPLAPLTHVRLGGPAAVLAEPAVETDVAMLVRACRELDVPLLPLGGGSNLVVADAGVDAVVVSLERIAAIVRDGARIVVGAGASLPGLLRATREVGLAGLEVLTGIPAKVGGAVAMNAGTADGETFDRLVSLTLVDGAGEIVVRPAAELAPRYRDGGLDGAVCVHATFELEEDDPAKIYDRFTASLRRRNASQPVTERSVGCVFRNPEGEAAGRLVDRAGCKGLRRGGVAVSHKHANYFVNAGDGTAADFLELMRAVAERVEQHSGVRLQAEVEVWGAAVPL